MARDAIPEALHVLDLLVDAQVVESGRGQRERLGHRGSVYRLGTCRGVHRGGHHAANSAAGNLPHYRGAAYKVLDLVGQGRFQTHISVPLVFEYEDALARHWSSLLVSVEAVESILDYHCDVGERHQIFFLWRPLLRDPKDDLVLELAVKARCDFIVTYNTRDFVGCERFDLAAITPAELLENLGDPA